MIPQNRTKIVATIGPASGSKKMLEKMIDAGMDIVRFNFSHGQYEVFEMWLNSIREIAAKKKIKIPIIQDLQGPRIRIEFDLPKKGLKLEEGQEVHIGYGKYKKGFIPIDYKNIVSDVKKGDSILLDDGLVELRVIKTKKKQALTKVIVGGHIYPRKGVNIPNVRLRLSAITEKDKKDLAWGMSHGVDYVALSFVRDANDLKKLRKLLRNKKDIKIIAKIEKPEAARRIKSILKVVDGIMIARGDLGIEIGVEKVPEVQKDIIKQAKKAKKLVIVATQMMESMIKNPSPTRAEVSDVANAVFDHTDAVMLSGETTVGKYPVQTVEIAEKIIGEAEKD